MHEMHVDQLRIGETRFLREMMNLAGEALLHAVLQYYALLQYYRFYNPIQNLPIYVPFTTYTFVT